MSVSGLAARFRDGSMQPFLETLDAVDYCTCPVKIVGSSITTDAVTGEILGTFNSDDAPLGALYLPCNNRREDVCQSCSRRYARDTFELIRCGLVGGKGVPATVANNPLLFVTLTAPSFGHVHGPRPKAGQPTGGRCRPRTRKGTEQLCEHGRPIGCMAVHDADDPLNGAPICNDCHDWHSAVVWQWWAPELWRRTTTSIRRSLATALGTTERELRLVASLQYAKVAEYQSRGLVHFHALMRLDGPDGPGSRSPLDGDDLAVAVRDAVRHQTVDAPPIDPDDCTRTLSWGDQLDVRVVRDRRRPDDPLDVITAEMVAGYLAKYASKDAGSLRGPGTVRPHLTRLERTCRDLAARAREQANATGQPTEYALLSKWARMLGFRGHFATKSRRFSVTRGQLQRARARYRRMVDEAHRNGAELDLLDLEARLMADDEETTLVVGSWDYVGSGWSNPGDKALALAAAARAREYAQWRAQTKHDTTRK